MDESNPQNSPKKKEATLQQLFRTQNEIVFEQAECRICLEPEEEGKKLIEPCRCSGSLNFVHEECLKKWIKRTLPTNGKTIRCELCGDDITFQFQQSWKCLSCQEFQEKVKDLYKPFLVLIFTILVVLGFIIFLLVLLMSSESDNQGEKIQRIVIGIVIGVAFIIKFSLWYMLCRQFILKKNGNIVSIQEKKKKKSKKKKRRRIRPVLSNSNFHQFEE